MVRFQVGLLNYFLTMKISEIKTLDNISAIYCFRNTINNKCYVGQAEQLRKRLLHHINNFKNCRYDAPLYRAMSKYGLDVFEVEILEIVDGLSDRMEIQEKNWMSSKFITSNI